MRFIRRSALTICAVTMCWACGGNTGVPPTPPPPPPATPTVTALGITGSAPQVGFSSQLVATATLSNATTQNVTTAASWQSSNQNVATVSSGGLVTGRAAGTVDLTATYQNVNGVTRLTITQPAPTTFTVGGTVTDGTSRGVLPKIQVRITGGTGSGRSTETDSSGRYTLSGLTAGTATLSFSAASYQTVERTVTVGANITVDIELPRTPVPQPPPPPPPGQPAPPASGAFVDVTTDSLTCSCSKGTIRVTANGTSIGTTTCAPATRRFEIGIGGITFRACDDLGCWKDQSTTVAKGEVYRFTLTCTTGITAQKLGR